MFCRMLTIETKPNGLNATLDALCSPFQPGTYSNNSNNRVNVMVILSGFSLFFCVIFAPLTCWRWCNEKPCWFGFFPLPFFGGGESDRKDEEWEVVRVVEIFFFCCPSSLLSLFSLYIFSLSILRFNVFFTVYIVNGWQSHSYVLLIIHGWH